MFQCARCEQNAPRDWAYESNIPGEDAICMPCRMKVPGFNPMVLPSSLVKADPRSMRPPVVEHGRFALPTGEQLLAQNRQQPTAALPRTQARRSGSWIKRILIVLVVVMVGAWLIKAVTPAVVGAFHVAKMIFSLIFLAIVLAPFYYFFRWIRRGERKQMNRYYAQKSVSDAARRKAERERRDKLERRVQNAQKEMRSRGYDVGDHKVRDNIDDVERYFQKNRPRW